MRSKNFSINSESKKALMKIQEMFIMHLSFLVPILITVMIVLTSPPVEPIFDRSSIYHIDEPAEDLNEVFDLETLVR